MTGQASARAINSEKLSASSKAFWQPVGTSGVGYRLNGGGGPFFFCKKQVDGTTYVRDKDIRPSSLV